MVGKIKSIAISLLFVLILFDFFVFSETIYYYIDKNGVYHFTDLPDNSKYKPFKFIDEFLSKSEIKYAVHKIAKKYSIDPKLVMAVIKVESGFNHLAESHKGAQGLMQLAPITQKELGIRCPFDPYANIEAGIRYLKYLMERYGKLDLTLAAYNAGPTAVDKYGGIPPYKETKRYVKKVLMTYRNLLKYNSK